VGAYASDLIGEVARAINIGADAVDIGKTIHPSTCHAGEGCRHGGGGWAWQLHACTVCL
jgi:hypothetical protein